MNKPITCAAALLFAQCCGPPLLAQPAAADMLAATSRRSAAAGAILELPREAPAEQLRAILTLIDLGEADAAAVLWKTLAEQNLDADTQAALVGQFGTARFLTLNGQDVDQFGGARAFVESCLQAAANRVRDPARLSRLIRQLNDPSDTVRRAARVDLAASSTAGATACLESLARATEKSVRANLLLTLADMRPEVDPMLLAVLADGRGQVRRDVAELAGHVQLFEAVPWLAAIVVSPESNPAVVSAAQGALTKLALSLPTAAEARSVIRNEIIRLEAGVVASPRPPAAIDSWWSFDGATGKLTARELSADTRQLLATNRIARLLLQLPNPVAEDRQLALIYTYQAAHELGQPPSGEVQRRLHELSSAEVNTALAGALAKNSMAAARALISLLGSRADPMALSGGGAHATPLARALVHADRQLRFSALQAVMQIAPAQTFAGASGVPKALWYFATGAGQPQAVVGAGVASTADDWAAQLRGHGYDASPAATGRQAITAAIASTRLKLLLLDSDVGQPRLREVVFQLRSSPRTARMPVAVLCSTENLSRARRIAKYDAWLIAVPRPHSSEAMQSVVDQLTEMAGGDDPPAQRLAQAKQALWWIAELLETGHPYDELLRDSHLLAQTVYVPELTEAALRALARVGTAGSQKLLVDLVSASGQSIEARRLAALALASSVKQAGKLLTSHEIRLQYDRYNASEAASGETQAVLGQVLDILEQK